MEHKCIYSAPTGKITIYANDEGINCVLLTAEGDVLENVMDSPTLAEAARQLDEYFAGERRSFDLPLVPKGTEFQKKVWNALREIPYGDTCTYGEIAAKIGNPKASRAVGMANNRNPLAIIVPCHRVIGANGSLTGYAGGLDMKKSLLDLERKNKK